MFEPERSLVDTTTADWVGPSVKKQTKTTPIARAPVRNEERTPAFIRESREYQGRATGRARLGGDYTDQSAGGALQGALGF